MAPISEAFVKQVEGFAKRNHVEVVRFERHQRKDDLAKERLARFAANEGVLFIGKAQEKTSVFRTQRRKDAKTGLPYPWLYRSTAMVNQVYFYCLDEDFGPFFLKYSTYFPYTGRLCLNGHEYLKRQLSKGNVAFEALDNGVLSFAEPARAQQICDELSAERIEMLFRRWQRRLPTAPSSRSTWPSAPSAPSRIASASPGPSTRASADSSIRTDAGTNSWSNPAGHRVPAAPPFHSIGRSR